MAKPVVGIEASDLTKLQRDLKKANGDALKLFRAALKKGGDVVADSARSRIAGTSQRIASSIRVGATNKGVYVRAGSKAAPHAAAFENFGNAGTFRHPVFGNRDVWVEQQAHPFLVPSLEGNLDKVVDLVLEYLDQLTGEAGFS